MGGSMKALTLKQICLLALLGTLCVTVDSHKHKTTEQEVPAASQRIVDQHLNLESQAAGLLIVAGIQEFLKVLIQNLEDRVTYGKKSDLYSNGTLHKESNDDSYNKLTSSTPVYSTDKHTDEVTSSVPKKTSTTDGYAKSTTEPLKTDTFLEDFKDFMKIIIQAVEDKIEKKTNSLNSTATLHKAGKENSSGDSYDKVVSSTTPVYSKDKLTSDASSNVSGQTSTTDGYNKSTSTTTAAYSNDQQSVESSKNEKPTQDVYSTTPMPSSSAIPRPPSLVGSISGVPGINFPDYTDIPITSFACSDKAYLPGFYADLETGCQVFHVCWQNRRESFLCPLGTTFNQALLACDYWYSTNCSLAPHYYSVNAESSLSMSTMDKSPKSMVDVLLEKSQLSVDSSRKSSLKPDEVLSIISKFLPVKAKVVIYPKADGKREKIVASTSVGKEEVVREVFQEEGEQKPLNVQKPEVSKVLTSTSEDKVVSKTLQIKDELKVEQSEQKETTKPQVSDDLRTESGLMARELFMKKLAEKVGFLVKKDRNIGLEKSTESSSVSPSLATLKPLDHDDIEAFKLATEFFSSILKIKLLFKMGQLAHGHEAVKTTYKPALKVVDLPESTQKPALKVVKVTESTQKPALKVVKVPESTKKSSVLTQLNPRFIVKPVSLPVKQGDKHVRVPTKSDSNKPIVNVHVTKPTGESKKYVVNVQPVPKSKTPVANVKHVPKPTEESKKLVVNVQRVPKPTEEPKMPQHAKYASEPNPYSGMNISQETKDALAKNYYKYMQIRKLS